MTILTECPTCDHPHMFEPDQMRGGWFCVLCTNCGAFMWVQATRIAGMTYDSAGFRENVMPKGDDATVDAEEARIRGGLQ
jgi:hypothetical protein